MSNPNNFKVYNNIPSDILRQGLNNQGLKGLKVLTKEVQATSLNTGAVVNLFQLPVGAVVLASYLSVNSAVATSSATTTVSVGSGANATTLTNAFNTLATGTTFAVNVAVAAGAQPAPRIIVGDTYIGIQAPTMAGVLAGSFAVVLLVADDLNA